jgi:hypothetical protein
VQQSRHAGWLAGCMGAHLVQRGPLLQSAGCGGLDGGTVRQRVRVGHPQLNHVGANLRRRSGQRAAAHSQACRDGTLAVTSGRTSGCADRSVLSDRDGLLPIRRPRTSSSFLMAATVVAASGSQATKKGMKAVLHSRPSVQRVARGLLTSSNPATQDTQHQRQCWLLNFHCQEQPIGAFRAEAARGSC